MNSFRLRGFFLVAGFGLVILIFIVRLFYLQALSDRYAVMAETKDLETTEIIPPRGIIYDRYENIYVRNSPIYDIKFLPKKISIPDTTILEDFLGMTREEIRERVTSFRGLNRYHWQDLKTQLDHATYARFSEQIWRFKGIKAEPKRTREYVYPCGAHFLGFINEVDPGDQRRAIASGDTVDYRYRPGNLIGKIGIERRYEKLMRGKKGQEVSLKDAYNRTIGRYADGEFDVKPVSGTDIKLGIDARLQLFGEQLMRNKRGSVVALEPSTGDILAFVSAPSFDPGLLTGSDLGANYSALAADRELPLVNRPLSAQYPPGSIFKILQALAAMSEGVINEGTHISCGGRWFRNRGKPGCHGAHGSCSLPNGIKHSCNSFFAEVYYSFLNDPRYGDIHTAYQKWFDIMGSYGIGSKLGVDIPDEKSGLLPPKEFYDRIYGPKGWGALTIYSNSIGQGEILMTPLQMANTVAMIANRGWYYPPHFLKAAKTSGVWMPQEYDRKRVPGTTAQYDLVVEAMEQVVLSGTATRARIDSISVCGKTGTVENKKGEDHSVFFAFAPKENPKIAIACIVENAGFGGTWAAPITSLMIEYYLKGEIKNQRKLDRILEGDFRWKPGDFEEEGEPAS